MKKVNALELRQSLGKVISLLERGGKPILIERGRKPAAVMISLGDYQERFVDKDADAKRIALRDSILQMARQVVRPADDNESAEAILREMRNKR
jgi:PHD/YefM family antitoxin component YafN of YafNO toxin-antitoxin module